MNLTETHVCKVSFQNKICVKSFQIEKTFQVKKAYYTYCTELMRSDCYIYGINHSLLSAISHWLLLPTHLGVSRFRILAHVHGELLSFSVNNLDRGTLWWRETLYITLLCFSSQEMGELLRLANWESLRSWYKWSANKLTYKTANMPISFTSFILFVCLFVRSFARMFSCWKASKLLLE